MHRKALGGLKREGVSPHNRWCQPSHRPLHWNPPWLRVEDPEPGNIRRLARGNPEEMPHIKYTEAQLSLTLSMCAYSHVLFLLPNKHLFHYFPSLCWNSFLQSRQARALPLATGPHGLVVGIQSSHCHGLASVSGQRTRSCFLLLLTKASQNQSEPSAQGH